jgi:hypothetical protein
VGVFLAYIETLPLHVENSNIITVRFLRSDILHGKPQYHLREIFTIGYFTWKTPISFTWDFYGKDFTWKTPISFPWDFYDQDFTWKTPISLPWEYCVGGILRGKLQYHSREIFTIQYFTWKTPISTPNGNLDAIIKKLFFYFWENNFWPYSLL